MKEIELGHGYKLRRLDAMNWQLWRFREPNGRNGRAKSGDPKWMPCGKYYQKLDSALRAVYELALSEGDECADLHAAMVEAERIAATLKTNVNLPGLGDAE